MARRNPLRGESGFRGAVAARVKQLRRDRHWSQVDLAEKLSKSEMQVVEIENPEPGVPATLGLIEDLAAAFELRGGIVEFLAPILDSDAETLEEEQRNHLRAELAARERVLLERHRAALNREWLHRLMAQVLTTGPLMDDQTLAHHIELLERWQRQVGLGGHPAVEAGGPADEDVGDGAT